MEHVMDVQTVTKAKTEVNILVVKSDSNAT